MNANEHKQKVQTHQGAQKDPKQAQNINASNIFKNMHNFLKIDTNKKQKTKSLQINENSLKLCI